MEGRKGVPRTAAGDLVMLRSPPGNEGITGVADKANRARSRGAADQSFEVERWTIAKSDRDAAWEYVASCREELVRRYPGQEVAVHRDRVVVHAANPADFERLLEAYVSKSGTDRNSLHFEHLDPDPPLFAG